MITVATIKTNGSKVITTPVTVNVFSIIIKLSVHQAYDNNHTTQKQAFKAVFTGMGVENRA